MENSVGVTTNEQSHTCAKLYETRCCNKIYQNLGIVETILWIG